MGRKTKAAPEAEKSGTRAESTLAQIKGSKKTTRGFLLSEFGVSDTEFLELFDECQSQDFYATFNRNSATLIQYPWTTVLQCLEQAARDRKLGKTYRRGASKSKRWEPGDLVDALNHLKNLPDPNDDPGRATPDDEPMPNPGYPSAPASHVDSDMDMGFLPDIMENSEDLPIIDDNMSLDWRSDTDTKGKQPQGRSSKDFSSQFSSGNKSKGIFKDESSHLGLLASNTKMRRSRQRHIRNEEFVDFPFGPKLEVASYDTPSISPSAMGQIKDENKKQEVEETEFDTMGALAFGSDGEPPSAEERAPSPDYTDGSKIPGRPATNVVYIPTSPFANLEDDGEQYTIPVWPTLKGAHGPVLGPTRADFWPKLEKLLGPGLCSTAGARKYAAATPKQRKKDDKTLLDRERIYIHQMPLTALYAKETRRITLTIRPWEMMSQANEVYQAFASDRHRKVIFFLPIDPFQWQQKPDLLGLYTILDNASYYRQKDSTTIYPSQHESYRSALKIPDIQAFDDIAATADDDKFAYRPKTCFGNGPCSLANHAKQVFKGTFSSGGAHVYTGTRTDAHLQGLLQCCMPGEKPKVMVNQTRAVDDPPKGLPGRMWFHQEYIDTLVSWGELGVFMIGDKIEMKLFSKVVNQDTSPGYNFLEFDPGAHFEWVAEEQRGAKVKELEDFCRWWRKRLLEEYPDLFNTMHVGVRFDIGISHLDVDGRFFINEASRWASAAFYMESWSGQPYDKLCRPLGRRFAKLYGSIISEDEAKAEGWSDEACRNYDVVGEEKGKDDQNSGPDGGNQAKGGKKTRGSRRKTTVN